MQIMYEKGLKDYAEFGIWVLNPPNPALSGSLCGCDCAIEPRAAGRGGVRLPLVYMVQPSPRLLAQIWAGTPKTLPDNAQT